MKLFLDILCGMCSVPHCFFLLLHCIYSQIHSELDPSHVEGEDDHDSTAHQEMPVVELVQDAAPSQSLEVTGSIIYVLYMYVYNITYIPLYVHM